MSMDITVAVVTYNSAGCIRQCIDSLLRLEYQNGLLEILVVDGCSNDGTREILGRYGDLIRVVDNPGRTIASNRNIAIREAKYMFVAFTDSDCVVPLNWLVKLSGYYEELLSQDDRVVGVGGGNIPGPGVNQFHEALSVAQNSFIGSLGSVQGMLHENVRKVESLACLNVLYSRDTLLSIGGFDENLENMCEDADMNYRLKRNGYHFYYIPDVPVIHNTRQCITAWRKNMFEYGKGRAKIMRKYSTLFSPLFILPVMFWPIMLGCLLFGFQYNYLWAAILYFPSMFLAGAMLAVKSEKEKCWFQTGLILCVTHMAYAAGLWAGFAKGYAAAK